MSKDQIMTPMLKNWKLNFSFCFSVLMPPRPCREYLSIDDRPIPIPYEEVHLGNKCTHVSHKLMKFRGLVYCGKCGMRGTTQLQKLGSACAPPTQYGRDSLAKLALGLLPPSLKSWPS